MTNWNGIAIEVLGRYLGFKFMVSTSRVEGSLHHENVEKLPTAFTTREYFDELILKVYTLNC